MMKQAPFDPQQLLFNLPQGVLVVNTEGRVVFANRAALSIFRVNEEHLIGKQFNDLGDLASQNFQYKNLATIYVHHQPIQVLKSVITEETNSQLHGMTLYSLFEQRSITQEALDLVGTISAEVRSPLTVVQGYLDILLRELVGEVSEEQRQLIKVAKQHSQNMLDVFNQLLLFTHLETDWSSTRPETFDVYRVVEDCIQRYITIAGERNIRINQERLEMLGMVYADQNEVQHIVWQILDNAVYFSREGGEIVIKGAGDETNAIITIADQGAGIPASDQPYLFDRRHYIHNRGAGLPYRVSLRLGLYIAKRLADRNDIKISIYSIETAGTTVSIQIPRKR